ncbi:tRNA (adenine-N1)-methyltransferase [Fervidicoccus fontis]|uniref:tRNA (Adenine-N1)-methyltransferase n=1 Tax=Fervidicoccus fontis TaxID=683846 RepID=A0A843A7B1_9CREN|nr:methyltransferase domain-containing protein [Fervidicoccus fontis]MBE9390673.1 tRNA (adenine-N1)-methyltransferase [Fervidicoccus fontis]
MQELYIQQALSVQIGIKKSLRSGILLDEGMPVVLFFPDNTKKLVVLKRGKYTESKYGRIKHDDIIGKNLLGKFVKTNSGARILVQKPTIDEIIYSLFKRKSQVIYPKDAYAIISEAGLKRGDKVGEAGVGSGFLAAHILSIIGNEGEYYGYDLRDDMIETAINNLSLLGYDVSGKIRKKDVKEGIDESDLNAFFLDLPDPWNAVNAIYPSLAPDARIVIFVPTLNQVIKFLASIDDSSKFKINRIFETFSREYAVSKDALRPSPIQSSFTGYIISLVKISE